MGKGAMARAAVAASLGLLACGGSERSVPAGSSEGGIPEAATPGDGGAPEDALAPGDAGNAADGGGRLVMYGGTYQSSLPTQTWTFDGAWSQLDASAPPAGYGASMATLGSQIVLVGGGVAVQQSPAPNNEVVESTWTFGGSTWTPLSTTTTPSWDPNTMATLGSEVVLFGAGSDSTLVTIAGNETWIFGGSSWTRVSPATVPPGREGALMATLGNKVVLYGGSSYASGDPLTDTWLFDGVNWSQVMTSTSPPASTEECMATLGNEVVLFGGVLDGPVDHTWIFDGSSWTELQIANPTPYRANAVMATLGNRVVLFGGETVVEDGPGWGSTPLNDTWTFDGSSWTQLTVANPPPSGIAWSMAFLP